ncbi:hypothetical protein BABINDRAFT_101722 [Babjeviella inositovora NRRL Y-12698]|uniref:Uncharacterized protein n=1 Tax=Babjeviella inositovora NRRL Y-12698 TaxID=984486 RepID=A0A1E3QJK2_9ASCO|nr:uncharacterized protein BABINDRAFT_101722 [Babjeviella inositovora NRRL Y-12698]ODQ77177.1 hypothetical protein BABINDRAFT_101722 [Babjeviella inositovora NRRL Y-12698]
MARPMTMNNLITQLQIPETMDHLASLQVDPTFHDPKDRFRVSLYVLYIVDLGLLLAESGLETLLFIVEVSSMYANFLRSISNSISTYSAVKPRIRRNQSVATFHDDEISIDIK